MQSDTQDSLQVIEQIHMPFYETQRRKGSILRIGLKEVESGKKRWNDIPERQNDL